MSGSIGRYRPTPPRIRAGGFPAHGSSEAGSPGLGYPPEFWGHAHRLLCAAHVSLRRRPALSGPFPRQGRLTPASPGSPVLWPDPTPPAPRRRSGLPRARLPGPAFPPTGRHGGLPGCSRPLVLVPMPHTPAAPTALALADGPVLPSTPLNVSAAAAWVISGLAHIGPFTPCLRFAVPVTRHHARLGPGLVASHWPVGPFTRWVRPASFRKPWTAPVPPPLPCLVATSGLP